MDSRTIFRLVRSSKGIHPSSVPRRILLVSNTLNNTVYCSSISSSSSSSVLRCDRRTFSSSSENNGKNNHTLTATTFTDSMQSIDAASTSASKADIPPLSSSLSNSSSSSSTLDEAPTSTVLEELARHTPGTSIYQSFQYDAASVDHPYPIWWLDPTGPVYKVVLSIARTSSSILENIHDMSSLPWWITILCTGALIRISILPLNIFSLRNASRAVKAQSDLVSIRQAYLQAITTLSRHNPQLSERIQLLLATLRGSRAALHRANCYPWRTFAVPFLQVPFVIAGVLGARHAVLLGDTRFETEGTLWFTDLTIPDPYYVLPMVSLSLAYLSVDIIFGGKSLTMRPRNLVVNSPQPTVTPTMDPSSSPAAAATTATVASSTVKPVGSSVLLGGKLSDVLKNVMQITIIFSAPFLSELPAGLYLLMSANSVWTIVYLSMVRHPRIYQTLVGQNVSSSPSPSSSSSSPVVPPSVSSSSSSSVQSVSSAASVVSAVTASTGPSFSTVALPFPSNITPSTRLVFPTASSLSTTDLQEILLRPRFDASSSRLSVPSSSTPTTASMPNHHAPYADKGLDGIVFYKFNGTSHEFHTKSDVVVRSTVNPAASLHAATSTVPVTTTATSVVSTPALSSVSSAAVLTHTMDDNLKSSSTNSSLDSNANVPVNIRNKSVLDNDSSAYLQSLPRLLYVDKVTTHTEEASLMRTLFRTFNVAFPIMHGHPNPLLFQIAGGAYRAPWAFIPIRPWNDAGNGSTETNKEERTNLVPAVKTSSVKTDRTRKSEDTGVVAVPTKETIVHRLSKLLYINSKTTDPKEWRTKENLLLAFRNQWAYGLPIAVRQRRITSANTSNHVPTVKHVVINPYMFGLPVYDSWTKGSGGASTMNSSTDTPNLSDSNGNETHRSTDRRQKRREKILVSGHSNPSKWDIQQALRNVIEQTAWETMLGSTTTTSMPSSSTSTRNSYTGNNTTVSTNTSSIETSELARLYYYPVSRKYSPLDKGLGYLCSSSALAGLRVHNRWFLASTAALTASRKKHKLNVPSIIVAGEPFMYSTLQMAPSVYSIKHTPDDSSTVHHPNHHHNRRPYSFPTDSTQSPNKFSVTGSGKEESLQILSKRYQAILNAKPGIFTVPSIDSTGDGKSNPGKGSSSSSRSSAASEVAGLNVPRYSTTNPQRYGERSWLPFAREQYHHPAFPNPNNNYGNGSLTKKKGNRPSGGNDSSSSSTSTPSPPGTVGTVSTSYPWMIMDQDNYDTNESLTNELLGNIETSLSKYFRSKEEKR